MADAKISALTNLTAADPTNDMIPIVDVSETPPASGNTKRISINNLLSSSPTASGALTVTGLVTAGSATITGDLTVRTNKLVVTSTGVGVGTASVNAFDVVSTLSTLSVFKRTVGNGAFIGIEDGSGTGLAYLGYTNGLFSIQTPGSGYSNKLSVDTSGYVLMGVASANTNGGVLQLTSGITFPATQVAASDANTLDDYEEGTWTIGLTFGGASTGITTTANTGKYTKVGRLVTVFGAIDLSSKGSSTGNAAITGLPFAVGGASSDYSAASLHLVNITFADFPMGFGNPTLTTIPLQEVTNAGVRTNLTDADFANNSSMIFSLTYSV